jgi:hypothetical protein
VSFYKCLLPDSNRKQKLNMSINFSKGRKYIHIFWTHARGQKCIKSPDRSMLQVFYVVGIGLTNDFFLEVWGIENEQVSYKTVRK